MENHSTTSNQKQKNENSKKKNHPNTKYFWAGIVGIISIIGTQFIYSHIVSDCLPDLSARGQFGDMFGTLNATFTGVAFVGLIITIWMQSNQLNMQSEELDLQRKEMRATRKEFLIDRITNIIYIQSGKCEKEIENLTIEFIRKNLTTVKFSGIEAIIAFSDKEKSFTISNDNLVMILKFLTNLLQNIHIVNEVLKNAKLTKSIKKELRKLFLINLGALLIAALSNIVTTLKTAKGANNIDETDIKGISEIASKLYSLLDENFFEKDS